MERNLLLIVSDRLLPDTIKKLILADGYTLMLAPIAQQAFDTLLGHYTKIAAVILDSDEPTAACHDFLIKYHHLKEYHKIPLVVSMASITSGCSFFCFT